jgi:phosphotriesterase-related protein
LERRAFLATVAAAASPVDFDRVAGAASDVGRVIGVDGPLEASALGPTLVHEHVLVDFVGADAVSPDRYDSEEALRVILPHLRAVRERGCRTLFEATPAYLGRDVALLRRLAEASGLQIVTNTGYYGAAGDRFVPAHAYRETPRQLAERWTSEFRHGLDGTGVRPGFLKIGVDAGHLSDIDRKLVEAAAMCHLDTGLTVAVHTSDGTAALDIVSTLADRGVAPDAYVFVHAQNATDLPTLDWLARQGTWIELDGIAPTSLARHVEAVVDLRRRGLLGRVLVSQDAGWYHVGEAGGGEFRPYTLLFDEFLPALRGRGITESEVRMLLETNPGRAFAVRVRRLGERG